MNPVFYSDHLPSIKKIFSSAGPKIKQALVFCDNKFRQDPPLKAWRKNKNLRFYNLPSGEKTKNLKQLNQHVKKILSLDKDFDKNSLCFISIGGGSLTDLTGFLASIYKRGLPVLHFPTTWLSAIDSAHGGKTALNFQEVKNILGSYHFPKAVFIVRNFLNRNPEKLKQEAWGELVKIALIEGGGLYKKLKSKPALWTEKLLKSAVQAKMKIVKQDPFELRGFRKKLNLGHTVGHILEALGPLSHGMAVQQGLLFSLNWSFYKGFMNRKTFEEIQNLIPQQKIGKISPALFKKHLRQDKKHRQNYKIDFIFIRKPGFVFVKPVSEMELLNEAKRQGLIKP